MVNNNSDSHLIDERTSDCSGLQFHLYRSTSLITVGLSNIILSTSVVLIVP